MSHIPQQPDPQPSDANKPPAEKVTVPLLHSLKQSGRKIVMLTAYDYPTARLADEAGVDIILVGDSLANTALGYDNTLPVTIDEMLMATRAVRRGVKRAMIVGDLPFGTFQAGHDDAMRAALRFIKEGGTEAVKVEGGRNRLALVRQMVENGIPVMGHIGLTPQSVLQMGGYKLQGKTLAAARAIVDDALSLEAAGAFAVVLEVIPSSLARTITRQLKIPTIGIGAGPDTDAQVLVINDLLGLIFGKSAKFVRRYADLRATISEAIKSYADDVRNANYPTAQEAYDVSREVAGQLERMTTRSDEGEDGYVLFAE
ncbi:MAG TPA: 3-methyl-2-oxobutanoate hydroxymethyltransferase [Blastocatellia bacterium]|nr:3-methyl-2-oxobutanoate hydroxymethyltransferase [Blastocatellia bacterium]